MEFDSSINLKSVATHSVASDKDIETFVHNLWDTGAQTAKNIAQAGETEIWLDYSDTLRTKYLSVYVEAEEGGYRLSYKAGSKPSRIGDAVMILCLLLAFWLGSKVLVPQPPVVNIVGALLSLAAAGAVVVYSGKAFGKAEAEDLTKKVK
ncbi:MAG: hypothetical protein MJY88_01285 [Bacteroidales bacterium]|nr:hypothetical protein [Bacteroidales bacterium]